MTNKGVFLVHYPKAQVTYYIRSLLPHDKHSKDVHILIHMTTDKNLTQYYKLKRKQGHLSRQRFTRVQY